MTTEILQGETAMFPFDLTLNFTYFFHKRITSRLV